YDAFTHPASGYSATTTNLVLNTSSSLFGVGTTTPWANISIHNLASSTLQTLFAIASTSNVAGTFSTTTLFSISNAGLASTTALTVSRQALFADGSAAAPSISFSTSGSNDGFFTNGGNLAVSG